MVRRVVGETLMQGIDEKDLRLTIDHMVPRSRDWQLVYEWDNLRLACGMLNRRKGSSEDVLDPFKIDVDGDAWFHMEMLDFRLLPNPKLHERIQERVKTTIDILGLNGPSWRATRWGDSWSKGILTKSRRRARMWRVRFADRGSRRPREASC